MVSLHIDSAYLLERKLRQWPIIKRAVIVFISDASHLFLFSAELALKKKEEE